MKNRANLFTLTLCCCLIGLIRSQCPSKILSYNDYKQCNFFAPKKYPVVNLDYGKFGGKCAYNEIAKKTVCRWLGIPYAKPPIGKLRFMPPEPPSRISGIYWALDFRNVCIPTVPIPFGSEDCLYLNVFVPNKCSRRTPCSVMIWIYGGAFLLGSGNSDLYGPDLFMAEDVIVVTFNYRLGPFGFASTEDGNIPGNAGLLDQHFVLKWVQRYIGQFGGDKNSVTIFGESAGAVSICYHCLIEANSGLFHKAIMQSGSCLSDWGIIRNPQERLIKLGAKFGIRTTNMTELKLKLQLVDAIQLKMAGSNLTAEEFTPQQFTSYAPSVDYLSPPYVYDTPRNMLQYRLANNLPVCHGAELIIGMNTDEGGGLKFYLLLSPKFLPKLSSNKELLTPVRCDLQPRSVDSVLVADKVYNHYFSSGVTQWNFYRYVTGMFAIDGETEFFKAYIDSGKSPYIYNFNYCGRSNYIRNFFFPSDACSKIRAVHADETFLEFTQTGLELPGTLGKFGQIIKSLSQSLRSSAERLLGRQMVRSFTNFAKTGTPNFGASADPLLGVNWLPVYNKSDVQVLNFDKTLTRIPYPFPDEIVFWENICESKF